LKNIRFNIPSLYQSQIQYDTHKYCFSNRIIPFCQKKVVSAATVNSLKARLGRFWANKEIYYNYNAHISCTGSRSNYDAELE